MKNFDQLDRLSSLGVGAEEKEIRLRFFWVNWAKRLQVEGYDRLK